MKSAIEHILVSLGQDLSRLGLKDTPKRVVDSLKELTSGYSFTPLDAVENGIFESETEGMVVQNDLEFYSLCEHHLLPFFGKVHVAYLPDKKILGLSKVGRLVDIFAKRLQVQEHLTLQIAKAIDEVIKPKGVGVLIKAQHFCMMMRGVKKQGSLTTTSEYLGELKDNIAFRQEFLSTIYP